MKKPYVTKMDSEEILTRLYNKFFEFENPIKIRDQLKVFAFVYSWLGVFPVRITKDSTSNSLFFLFWSFAVYGIIFSNNVDDLFYTKPEEAIRIILFPIVTVLVCILTSKDFIPLLKNLQRYDEDFGNLWITKRHRRLKGSRLLWTMYIPIILALNGYILTGTKNVVWQLDSTLMYALMKTILESLPYVVLTFYLMVCNELKLRFLDLKESFSSFLESSYKYSPEDFLQRAFEKYRLMHFKLTNDCVHTANLAFGNQIICCYIWCALNAIITVYYSASGDANIISRAELIMIMNCFFMYIVPVLCDGLTKASSELVTELFMIPISKLKMKTKLQITIFVHEVTLNKSIMTANGYFDLRKSFIATAKIRHYDTVIKSEGLYAAECLAAGAIWFLQPNSGLGFLCHVLSLFSRGHPNDVCNRFEVK